MGPALDEVIRSGKRFFAAKADALIDLSSFALKVTTSTTPC